MFYRLKDGFALRGFERLSCILIKRPYNDYIFLNEEQFRVLLLCDGITSSNSFYCFLNASEKETLENLIKKNIVEKTKHPVPLNEDGVYRVYNNRFFDNFFWSITGKCNYKCRHCYMDAPHSCLGELSHDDALKLIDEMAGCGALKIDITGGEPLVRNDFWDIIDYLTSKKIAIGQIYTNAALLDKETLNGFLKRNLKPQICISFDGIGWHDWLRGVDGAEQKAFNALNLCKEMGFTTTAACCVHKGNLPVLEETVNKLADLNVSAVSLGNITSTPLWAKNSEGNNMSFQEYADAMISYIPKFFSDNMPCNLLITGIIELYKGSKNYCVIPGKNKYCEKAEDCYLCGAVRNNCYITPEGRILPCMPMTECKQQELFPCFKDKGLKNILHDSKYFSAVNKRLSDLIKENEECRNCPYVYSCLGGCRAMALHSTGNIMGIDPDQCFLWKNSYPQKIENAAKEAVKKYCRY